MKKTKNISYSEISELVFIENSLRYYNWPVRDNLENFLMQFPYDVATFASRISFRICQFRLNVLTTRCNLCEKFI